ncbi:hypothetical protein [Acidianus brierleyi]|nr:hypothetical protein [Acidianus brierleyi]
MIKMKANFVLNQNIIRYIALIGMLATMLLALHGVHAEVSKAPAGSCG